MNQLDFKNKHKGETIICIGNGPGLKNIPPAFLEAYTNIGVNYILHYLPFLKLDYWLTIDKECIGATPKDVTNFIPMRYMNIVLEDSIPMILWEEIRGIPFSSSYGVSYSTSLAAAIHLAVFLFGAGRVLVVGFDCTFPTGPLIPHIDGKSNLPHFYDSEDKKAIKMLQWDQEMLRLKSAVEDHRAEIINCSIPTRADSLEQGDYRDYWRPE